MKDYKKYYVLPASPEEVYMALTNPFTIELWTGEQAEMSTEPGSEFTMFDGSISGRNITFEENKKIVQQWYFGDQPEASIVTFKLHPKGQETSVELRHTNIPEQDFDHITTGWGESFFTLLHDFYAE